MELYQLKSFVEIARTGNLTEAAVQLKTSQPATSAQLKALENELGFALFYRTSRGMVLTEKGSQLLPEAQKILASIDDFHYKASDLLTNSTEPIRIGLNTDGQVLQIKPLIESISESLPQVELHFMDSKSEDFFKDVTSSRISAGFYYGTAGHPSVHSIKLYSFRMVVVYPNSWSIPEGELTLEYFAQKPWIWTTQGCPFYKQSINYFLQQNLLPLKIMYVDDESLIGDLVGRETGCSLLAEPIAMRFAEDNKLQIWNGIDLEIDLYFGYPKDKRSDSVLREIGLIVERMWQMAESEH
ncbi:LysR family transcriptional regulator [Paenibacillus sp. IHBB 3054]|uniref:LysR family transcriptional regulator n=1 Tax=Paenibacillus sp. IHBB 3054 TaxID=3425689 RepID=UPI003F68048C